MVYLISKIKFIYIVLNEKGKPGYDVITPFETLRNEIVLVNRGMDT